MRIVPTGRCPRVRVTSDPPSAGGIKSKRRMIGVSSLERDMARVFLLRKQAKALEEEAKEILERYTFERDEAFSAGDFIVRVNRTRRFDPALAKKVLTADEYAATLVTQPDSTLAKRVLPQNVYESTQKEYGWTVKVEEVRDDGE